MKLLIGSNSRLGNTICKLTQDNSEWFYTQRKKPLSSGYIFFDFLHSEPSQIFGDLPPPEAVLICAGITNYSTCQEFPEISFNINVLKTVELGQYFLRRGSHVIFISSNTVLSQSDRSEYAPYEPSPSLVYTQHKILAEKMLLDSTSSCTGNLSIVRLTKNVDLNTSPFGMWMAQLQAQKRITAFSDLYMAPITFSASAEVILAVANHKESSPAIYHLSGVADISYYDYAVLLAEQVNISTSLVKNSTAAKEGVRLLYSSEITYLSMSSTANALGIVPIPPEATARYLSMQALN